tara:strand:- start:353 stop:715 length:363 start_codon:yes stop_codon:yes gene_type:complete
MALSGKKDPNLNLLIVGKERKEIEAEFGEPIKSQTKEDGTNISTYHFEIGNEPSTGRAVAHGAMDVFTLGLWEFVGTTSEHFIGEEYNAVVSYDNKGVVTSSNISKATNAEKKQIKELTN